MTDVILIFIVKLLTNLILMLVTAVAGGIVFLCCVFFQYGLEFRIIHDNRMGVMLQ